MALLFERLRQILKKIIRKMHQIAWLRTKFGFPVGKENEQSKAENIEMERKEDEILSKIEGLIDAAIDIGGETALKNLAEKLNASARV